MPHKHRELGEPKSDGFDWAVGQCFWLTASGYHDGEKFHTTQGCRAIRTATNNFYEKCAFRRKADGDGDRVRP